MARNSTYLEASPDVVWDVLADPYAYPKWVVGTDRTTSADAQWPAPGASFQVKLPFGLKDRSTCREATPGVHIQLDAAAAFFGPARVDIRLHAEGDGTRFVIDENPAGKLKFLSPVPPVQWAIRLRNVEAMRRLRRLVAQRTAIAATR